MVFKRKYHEKEIKCNHCGNTVKPILKKNKLKNNFYGMRYTGTEKKYLLVCPVCKKIIGIKLCFYNNAILNLTIKFYCLYNNIYRKKSYKIKLNVS